MRGLALVLVLMGLAGCDDLPAEGGNPGLFEPRMFNDMPYNVSFVGSNPVDDPALLAQGFRTSRDIEVFRMFGLDGAPFDAADAAEAEAVAADFCIGPNWVFVASLENIRFDGGGFVFSRSCLDRES